MIHDSNDTAEAIYFFGNHYNILKEMSLTEFNAILDGYATFTDMANKEVKAAYVLVNNRFLVTSVVFFKINITANGEVESSWALPLAHISQISKPGPDLGAGEIRLASFDQTPNNYFKEALWQPDKKNEAHYYNSIKKTATRNRVGFHFTEATGQQLETGENNLQAIIDKTQIEQELTLKIRQQYALDYKNQITHILDEQRKSTEKLQRQHAKELEHLKKQHIQRIENYQNDLAEQEKQVEEAEQKNHELKRTIEGQIDKITILREYFEHKIHSLEGKDEREASDQKTAHELEITARINAAIDEYQEQILLKDIQITQKDEQIAQLDKKIDELKKQQEDIMETSIHEQLLKMIEKGVSLVTYQPGAGHLTLPLSGLTKYMQDPTAYIAEYCGVSTSTYTSWLEHYQMPVCSAQTASGEICGDDIPRIESPTDFYINECDRCAKHKSTREHPHLRVAGE